MGPPRKRSFQVNQAETAHCRDEGQSSLSENPHGRSVPEPDNVSLERLSLQGTTRLCWNFNEGATEEVVRHLSQEVLEFEPERPTFLTRLKSAPRGSSPGPGGCAYEHLKTLDESDTTELLFGACSSFAQSNIPEEVASVLMRARLTALSKPDGAVRGIATGCSLRRFVARTPQSSSWRCSKQSARRFNTLCPPERGRILSGTWFWAATDADPRLTILSVDATFGA